MHKQKLFINSILYIYYKIKRSSLIMYQISIKERTERFDNIDIKVSQNK